MLLVLGVASACGGKNAANPGGAIASPDFCARFVEAACDRGIRCGMAPTDRAVCRAQVADTFDECPFMVEAVVRDEADYDEDAAGIFVEAARDGACAEPFPDSVALGVFTPRRDAGLVCHSKVSCKAGLACVGHTISTPEGVCGAP